MKSIMLCGLVVAAGAVSSLAVADDDTGAWYVSPMLQYDLLDTHRAAKDNFGLDIAVGHNFAPHFAGEFNYSNGSFPIHGMASQKLAAYTLDGLFKILPGAIVDPYVILGGGELDDTIGRGNGTTNTWTAEAGVGALTGLGAQTGSFRLQLRTEAKYRREFVQNVAYNPNNPSDILFNVGLQFEFGAPVPPPPAAPPPPPPQAAEPPPPPPPPAPEPCHAPAGFQVDANCNIIEQKVIVRAVDFEFNSALLTVPAQQTLDDIDHALLNQPELQIEIQGYTDSVGTDAYNLNLSRKRAEAVKAYLVSKGVNDSVLTAKGYGKADPIASNANAEGRAENRRVAFVVSNAPAHIKVVTEDASAASTEAAKQGEPAKLKKEPQH